MNESASATPWRLVGAAVQGVMHFSAGIPCQDAFLYVVVAGGPLLVAVADGAGSAPLSEVGSQTAVNAGIQAAQQLWAKRGALDQDDLAEVFSVVRNEVIAYAERNELPTRSLASTLSLVAIYEAHVVGASIGDSGCIVCSEGGELIPIWRPQKGEYANETNFLTGNNWEEVLDRQTVQVKTSGFLAGSDGLFDFLLAAGKPVDRLIQPLLQFIEQCADVVEAKGKLDAFLRSDRVRSRVYDDVTLVLGWKEQNGRQ